MLDQNAVGIEDVDIAETGARHVVIAGRILLGIGDIDLAVDGLDVERRVVGRDGRVGEPARHRDAGKISVEDVDALVVEIGSVQPIDCPGQDGQPLVIRRRRPAVINLDNAACSRGRQDVDRPGFGGENEGGAVGNAREDPRKGHGIVIDDAGRMRRPGRARGNGQARRLHGADIVVDRRQIDGVVGDQHHARRGNGDAPAVFQIGVDIDAGGGHVAGQVPGLVRRTCRGAGAGRRAVTASAAAAAIPAAARGQRYCGCNEGRDDRQGNGLRLSHKSLPFAENG